MSLSSVDSNPILEESSDLAARINHSQDDLSSDHMYYLFAPFKNCSFQLRTFAVVDIPR